MAICGAVWGGKPRQLWQLSTAHSPDHLIFELLQPAFFDELNARRALNSNQKYWPHQKDA